MTDHERGSGTGARWTRVVAGGLVGLTFVLVAASVTISRSSLQWVPGIVVAAVVGGVLVARRPDNPISWIMLTSAALGAVVAFGLAFEDVEHLPAVGVWAAWLANAVAVTNTLAPIAAMLLVFPTGQLPSTRWRWVAAGLGVSSVGAVIGFALLPGHLESVPTIVNPVRVTAFEGVAAGLVDVSTMALVPLAMVACVAPVVRFRRTSGVERQQIKWLALAAVTFVASLGSVFLGDPVENGVVGTLLALGWSTIPAAIGVAVLRYGLYEIDRLINRTVVYSLVTITLGLCYAGLVVLLQPPLSRVTAGSELAVAASTLAVAAAFGPVRRRIQALVDRRFNRARYDAARMVEAFAHRLRDQLDLDALTSELHLALSQTVQPSHAALLVMSGAADQGPST